MPHARVHAIAGCCLLLLACSDGSGPDPGPEPEPLTNGRIAYASAHEHGSLSHIYAVEGDGSATAKLTAEVDLYQVVENDWAPRITFYRTDIEADFAYFYSTMAADGSGRTGPFLFDFDVADVSSDASAVIGYKAAERVIAIGDLATGEEREVSTGSLEPGGAFWSPDGERIGFTGRPDEDSPWDLYTMGADGSDLIRLTDDLFAEGSPTWSPTGDRIAFIRSAGPGHRLSVVNADGSGLRDIYPHPCELPIGWSPDGSQVLCTNSVGVTAALIDVETGEAHNTDFTFNCRSWSPDGTRLVCTDQTDVFTVNPDGTNRVRLGPDGGVAFLTWLRLED